MPEAQGDAGAAAARAALAPNGILRVGINTANYLLVKSASPEPEGLAPSLALALAERLGAEAQFMAFSSPKALAEAAGSGTWDVGFVGADPSRAEVIAFSAPYVEIPASYLVRRGSGLSATAEVDRKGLRIASITGAAFDFWLERNVRQAEVVRAPTMDAALELFQSGKADILAGLKDRLVSDQKKVSDSIILDGYFMSVLQAVGAPRGRGEDAAKFLYDFVEEAKSSGLVTALLEKHGVQGRLIVAPSAASAVDEVAQKRRRMEEAAPAVTAPKMKIAILGCGAMGSVYAGLLASNGNDVWAVDVWKEHVEAIRKDGLRVEGASGDRTVRLNATCDPADIGSAELVVIATKASGVAAAAEVAAKLVTQDGVVLTIQNGLGAGDRIAKHIKSDQVMLGIASNFGASVRGPGHAEHRSMNLICLGEMTGGDTARLQRVAAVWAAAGFKVQACPDINKMIWEKFICNCTYSSSCTLTGLTVGEVQDDPSAWSVALACAKEAYAVARAQGIKLCFDDVEDYVRKFGSSVRAAKPSMLQDHLAKRRSEIDAINGAVPVEAAKVGMSAPVNQTVADLVRARESTF